MNSSIQRFIGAAMCVVAMVMVISLTATAQTQYTVTVNVTPEGAGTVSGGGTFDEGTVVHLDVSANYGYTFSYIDDNDFILTGDVTITAHFDPMEFYVSAWANPPDAASMFGEMFYTYNSYASISYAANPGYTFIGWTGDPNGLVTGDMSVTANFTRDEYTIAVVADPPEAASVYGAGTYYYGDYLSLGYSENPGYTFVGWSDDPYGMVTGNATITAFFQIQEFTLQINEGNGKVDVDPSQPTYTYGTTVTLSATPNGGYQFQEWSGDILSNSNPESFTIYNNSTVSAIFVPITPAVEATALSTVAKGPTMLSLSFTPGDGMNRIVVCRQGAPVAAVPVSGMTYSSHQQFGLGDSIGTGQFVVYDGPSTNILVTGLSPGTTYYFKVFEFNGVRGDALYSTGSNDTSGTTLTLNPGKVVNLHGGMDRVSSTTAGTTQQYDVTLEGWVRWGGTTGGTQIVLMNGNSGTGGFGIILYNDGVERLHGLLAGITFLSTNPAVTLPVDTWTHLAFQCRGGEWQLFMNGERKTLDGTTTSTPNAPPNEMSAGGNSLGEGFNGAIDEVRVSDVARYSGSFTPSYVPFDADDNTRLLWRFEEADGTTALDASGNGNAGTFYGGAARINYNAPLPVELTSFASSVERMKALLTWKTMSETNNAGFDIERRPAEGATPHVNAWEKIGFIAGAGTSNEPREYSFSDAVTKAGRYAYRLKQIDNDGSFIYSSAIEAVVGSAARVLALEQNFPNPFNPATTIEFTVPADGHATLRIYNMLGQMVATLFDGTASAGVIHHGTFDASKLSSGIYFSRLECGGKQLMKRMVLMK